MDKKTEFEIEVPLKLSSELLSNVLCSAFDPGYASTGYWGTVDRKVEPLEWLHEDKTRPEKGGHWLHEYPLSPGGKLIVWEQEEDKRHEFGLEQIRKGLDIMARDFPKHFGDIISENDDAITADVLVQCGIFGEVKYG